MGGPLTAASPKGGTREWGRLWVPSEDPWSAGHTCPASGSQGTLQSHCGTKSLSEDGRDRVRNKPPRVLTPQSAILSQASSPFTPEKGTEPIQPHWFPSWRGPDLTGSRRWTREVLCVEGQDQQTGGTCRNRTGGSRVNEVWEQEGIQHIQKPGRWQFSNCELIY